MNKTIFKNKIIQFLTKGAVGIMQNQKLFEKVVPQDQFFDHSYAGKLT
jgi:hypothetical protein